MTYKLLFEHDGIQFEYVVEERADGWYVNVDDGKSVDGPWPTREAAIVAVYDDREHLN